VHETEAGKFKFSGFDAAKDPCLIEVKGRELKQQFIADFEARGCIGKVLGQVRQDHFAVGEFDSVKDRASWLEYSPVGLNGGVRHG
jgi:hypothetical protein